VPIYRARLTPLHGNKIADGIIVFARKFSSTLDCHPEPFASLEGKLSEGSGSTDGEMLRPPTKYLNALHCAEGSYG
jgi:hypothetical protein